MQQHTILYVHPDTDKHYYLTFTVSYAVKYPSDPFSRFQEPEDETEVILEKITDSKGTEVSESNFEKHIVQNMLDHCYLEAVEL